MGEVRSEPFGRTNGEVGGEGRNPPFSRTQGNSVTLATSHSAFPPSSLGLLLACSPGNWKYQRRYMGLVTQAKLCEAGSLRDPRIPLAPSPASFSTSRLSPRPEGWAGLWVWLNGNIPCPRCPPPPAPTPSQDPELAGSGNIMITGMERGLLPEAVLGWKDFAEVVGWSLLDRTAPGVKVRVGVALSQRAVGRRRSQSSLPKGENWQDQAGGQSLGLQPGKPWRSGREQGGS